MATVLIDGRETDRAEWLAERRQYVGASEVGTLLGFGGSKLRLYLRKRGELPDDEPTEEMAWGLRLEDDIAEGYLERTGRRIVTFQQFVAHSEIGWMSATIDGITEDGRLVEFKSVGMHGHGATLGEDGDSDSVPAAWLAQTSQAIECGMTNGVVAQEDADIAVFGPGLRLRIFPIRRSEQLVRMAEQAIRAFMLENVIPGIPPAEIVRGDADLLARSFRGDTGEWLTLGEEIETIAQRHQERARILRELDEEQKVDRARILMALGNASGAEFPGGWSVERKVVTVNHKAREASVSEQVRLSVKGPE